MACADIVRSCTLRNSYITVVSSPGCTCTERCAGLKSHGPRAFASNSTVIVRDRSTCELRGALPFSGDDSTLTRMRVGRSEEHTSELQSLTNLVCRLLLEKKKADPT